MVLYRFVKRMHQYYSYMLCIESSSYMSVRCSYRSALCNITVTIIWMGKWNKLNTTPVAFKTFLASLSYYIGGTIQNFLFLCTLFKCTYQHTCEKGGNFSVLSLFYVQFTVGFRTEQIVFSKCKLRGTSRRLLYTYMDSSR